MVTDVSILGHVAVVANVDPRISLRFGLLLVACFRGSFLLRDLQRLLSSAISSGLPVVKPLLSILLSGHLLSGLILLLFVQGSLAFFVFLLDFLNKDHLLRSVVVLRHRNRGGESSKITSR